MTSKQEVFGGVTYITGCYTYITGVLRITRVFYNGGVMYITGSVTYITHKDEY